MALRVHKVTIAFENSVSSEDLELDQGDLPGRSMRLDCFKNLDMVDPTLVYPRAARTNQVFCRVTFRDVDFSRCDTHDLMSASSEKMTKR